MPEALVTGGAGFIGATLVRMLSGRGYEVRVYDDLSTGTREHLDDLGIELVEGDVRDLDRLTNASRGADTVFHLAAGAGVVDSIENPLGNFDVNARGTLVARANAVAPVIAGDEIAAGPAQHRDAHAAGGFHDVFAKAVGVGK